MIPREAMILAGLGLAGCGAQTSCPCGLDGEVCEVDAAEPGDAPPGGRVVPYLAGTFQRVYAPSGGRYLNDHALTRGTDGDWHLIGIEGVGEGEASAECSFLHAIARSPYGPWTELDPALWCAGDESVLWAPHAIARAPGRWTMFYWGGTGETRAPYRSGLRRADSDDLLTWTRNGYAAGGRDPMVVRAGGRWLLYSVGVTACRRGQILVSESQDLWSWSEPRPVLTDPVPSYRWGNLESPFVLQRQGSWFLFLTRTGRNAGDYWRTTVFRSGDPRHFVWRPVAELPAHAAEVVEDQGAWYVTSAGWTSIIGEEHRGLSIAPLGWAAE